MKCVDCKTKNINDANYCINCCHQFTEEEKKKARKRTLVGLIETIEQAYNVCTLKIITDHILFKIASIVLILFIGIYTIVLNGTELKIEKNPAYEISYNSSAKEYYLKVKEKEAAIDLYVPNKATKVLLKHYDKDHNLLEETEFSTEDQVKADTNKEDDYYIIEAIYSETNLDKLKVFLYQEN